LAQTPAEGFSTYRQQDARASWLGDAQGVAEIRFALADQTAHECADVEKEGGPAGFIAQSLGEGRFPLPGTPNRECPRFDILPGNSARRQKS